MASINMQQCFVRNEQLKHYPTITIDSIPSKFQLIISSTSNMFGKCLFVLIMFILNLVHGRAIMYSSLDSVFTLKIKSFLFFLIGNWMFITFYFRYNHKLIKQIDEHLKGLQIDFDYETRKYFWTRTTLYRWFIRAYYIFSFIIRYCYELYTWSVKDRSKLSSEVAFKRSIIFYFLLFICAPVAYFKHFCQIYIEVDLPILAQTAVQFNLIKLKKLLNETTKDEKSLNLNAIKNIRHKYLLSCRLVDQINEVMSPALFFLFTNFIINTCNLSYTLLYTEQSYMSKCYNLIQNSFSLVGALLSTYSSIKIHDQSLESLATVYKLSLKTNSIRTLNEISLFLNHKEMGFTLGGMFMLTTSSLSTLFSIFITIVFALPTFAS
uniref:Gustatory receptor n=1 Tax=Tetranychus urticae TaxID=32264 RepID=T1KJ71_TETUR